METIHLYNLSNLCRVCLKKTDTMFHLFDSSDGLYDTFTAIANVEIHRDESFPNYICSTCQDTILRCQQLISQFKQTNELLEKYKHCSFKVEQDDNKVDLESIAVTEIIEYVSDGEDISLESIEEADQDDEEITSGRKQVRMQFPYDEVVEAIEELQKKMKDIRMCTQCNFFAKNYRSLSLHMSRLHRDLKHRWCATCNKIVEDLATHHHAVDYSCRFCGKVFSTPGQLMEHLANHRTIRPSKRKNSNKPPISTEHLHIHNETDVDNKPYTCSTCDCSFPELHQLENHSKQHHYELEVPKFTCEKCKQNFDTTKALQEHPCTEQLSNCETVKVRFNYCEVCQRQVRSLIIHNQNFHQNNQQVTKQSLQLCTVCGKQFKNASRLTVHMRVHTGETPYSCRYCGKKMAARHHLIEHERVHTGVKPHVCHICNKAFTQKGVLNTHMKLHTGRPELCVICGKKYCRPAELRLHMKTHTGEKSFTCSYCGKNFVQRSHLVEHIRGHSGDKPFKCLHCNKTYCRSSSLKDHMQIHLGKKPFKCTECAYAARRKYSLTVHMRQHDSDV